MAVSLRSQSKSRARRRTVTPASPRFLSLTLAALGLYGAAVATPSAFADDPATTAPVTQPGATPAPVVVPTPAVAGGTVATAPPALPTSPASAPVTQTTPPPVSAIPVIAPTPVLTLPTAGKMPSRPAGSAFSKSDPNNLNAPVTLVKPKKSSGERLLGPLGRGLTVIGSWTLHGQKDSVSGFSPGTQLYNDQNVSGLDYRRAGVGALQQNMDMTIQGKILNVFSVNAHLSNSRYGNSFGRSFGFNYKKNGTSLDLGTINASLPGDELVPFSRSVEGIIIGRDFGNHVSQTSFASITRAVTQHGSFQGQGTPGPYYMNASSIVPGSEHVQFNGRDLQAGVDYNLDYILGQINFLHGLSINQTDTVTYTYESQSYNTTPGLLAGTRWSATQKDGTGYGMTVIKQKAVGFHTRNGNLTQYFPVYGVAGSIGGVADPQYKYQLSSPVDTNYPLVVKWQNEVLTLNVDYVLNIDLHFFQLKRVLPADTSETGIASLNCTFHPVQQLQVSGDKSVYAFDTRMKVAPNGTVGLTYASSAAQVAAQSGTGMILNSNWHSMNSTKNAWEFSTSLKDVGQNFSSIDSTSTAFLQAQKGLSSTFKFIPNQYYNFSTSLTNSRVSTISPFTSLVAPITGNTATAIIPAAPVQWSKNQGITAAMNVTLPRLPTFSLTHSQTTQDTPGITSSHSSFTNDGITAGWTKGIFALTGAVTNTRSRGASIFSTFANNSVASTSGSNVGTLIDQANNGTYAQTLSGASSLMSRLSLSMTPAAWISLNGDVGVSRNRTGTAASATSTSSALSTARNVGWGVNLQPNRCIIASWTVSDSSNGQSTAAFLNAATASAAAGTSSSQLVSGISGQETRSNNLSLQYTPVDWLSASVQKSTQLALIPGQDNSASNSTTLSLTSSPTRKLQLGVISTRQTVTYVGGEGSSNNASATVTSTAGPFGRMSFTTALMRMNYGSATYTTVSGGTGIGGGVGALGGNLFGGSTSSGLIQQGLSTTISLQTDYALGGNRSLFGRWRSLQQGSPTAALTSTSVSTGSISPGSMGSSYVSTNYRQGTGTVGLEMRLTDVVGFTVNYNLINMTDQNNPRYSYHARSFTTDLSARF